MKWNKIKDIKYLNTIDYQFVTSKLVAMMYSYNWALHPSKYIYLWEPVLEYYENININQLKNKINNIKSKYKKVILYAPTYRWTFQNYNINSVLDSFFDLVKNNKNIFFYLSLHPADKDILNNKNKKIINSLENLWMEKDFNTDDLLPYVDMLITDASTIINYGIYLKKEIIIFFPDYEEYIKWIDLLWNRLEIYPKEIIYKKYNKNLDNILNNYNIDLSFLRNLLYEKDKYLDNKKIYDFIVEKLKD